MDDDHKKWLEFMADHRGHLLAKAHRLGLAGEDAEEFVSYAFAQAWIHRESHDPAKGTVDAWLNSILHNGCMDKYRLIKRRREVALEPAMVEHKPGGAAAVRSPEEIGEELRWLLGHLSEQERVVVTLKYLGGLDTAGIARELDIAEGTVRATLVRAKNRARALLGLPPPPRRAERARRSERIAPAEPADALRDPDDE